MAGDRYSVRYQSDQWAALVCAGWITLYVENGIATMARGEA